MSKTAILATIVCLGITALFAAEFNLQRNRQRMTQSEQKKVISQRASHQDLATRQRPADPDLKGRTVKRSDLRRVNLGEVPAENAQDAQRLGSLVARSTIISGGSNWTIVPKQSVLHVPARFKARVDGKRNGKLVGWHDFYARNTTWIRLLSVSVAQARGDDQLTKEYLESLQRTGLLVVAVCKGGPITVKLPKEGQTEDANLSKAFAKPVKAAEW